MAYNHGFCMFCGQALPEGSEARTSARPLCDPCRELDAQGRRLCPACRETIHGGATVCHVCQCALTPAAAGTATSTYAVVSLVAGIFGPFFCGIPAILAIVFGFLALKEIRGSSGAVAGAGMAKWGRGLGIAWLALGVLVVALSFIAGVVSGASGN